MKIVDTNIGLRYLLRDHPEHSPRAAEFIEQQDVFLRIEIACEVVFVLQKVYHVSRSDIRSKLTGLLQKGLITVERPHVFEKAFEVYADSTLDIVDTFLCADHLVEHTEILTFDEKLQNV